LENSAEKMLIFPEILPKLWENRLIVAGIFENRKRKCQFSPKIFNVPKTISNNLKPFQTIPQPLLLIQFLLWLEFPTPPENVIFNPTQADCRPALVHVQRVFSLSGKTDSPEDKRKVFFM